MDIITVQELKTDGWEHSTEHPETGAAISGGWWILPASNMITPIPFDEAVKIHETWKEWECWGLKRD